MGEDNDSSKRDNDYTNQSSLVQIVKRMPSFKRNCTIFPFKKVSWVVEYREEKKSNGDILLKLYYRCDFSGYRNCGECKKNKAYE